VEKNRPARDRSGENADIPQSYDYEYDEAQHAPAWSLGGTPSPHRVHPLPQVNLDAGGDYGYDEVHGFGAS
jgi:hypothetical protein